MWDSLCEWAGPCASRRCMRASGPAPALPLAAPCVPWHACIPHIWSPPRCALVRCCRTDKYSVLLLVYLRMCCGKIAGNRRKDEEGTESMA